MSKPKFNILNNELEELSYTPVGFFDKLLHKSSKKFFATQDLAFTFKVPVSNYLRAELFCEDVAEASDYEFTHEDLIDILFEDFMYQAKMRGNVIDLYRELEAKFLEQSIQIHDVAQSLITITNKKERMKVVECMITRREALRLEVMLSDIADLELERNFTINDVLQILYNDFVLKYKSGELTNILPKIIKRLNQQYSQ